MQRASDFGLRTDDALSPPCLIVSGWLSSFFLAILRLCGAGVGAGDVLAAVNKVRVLARVIFWRP